MIIGYQNHAETATLTVSEEATGFPKENAVDYRLDDWWRGTSTVSLTVVTFDFNFGSSKAVDYLGLAGHNFGSGSISFKLQRDDNAGYTSPTDVVGATTPTTDAVLIKTFNSASDRYWRLRMTMLSTTPPTVGHISLGARYTPPVAARPGFVMPKYGTRNKYINSIGDTGLFIGRSLIRETYEAEIDLALLSAAQMRTDIDPLIAHALAKPFFFNWDNTNYPAESAYCWLTDDPRVRTDSAVHYGVTLQVRALV